MRDIRSFLTSILAYYEKTTKVGHTRALYSGVGYLDIGTGQRPFVVTHDKTMGRILSPDHNVSIDELQEFMTKRKEALIWDNQALVEVLTAARDQIDSLEGRLLEAKGYRVEDPMQLELALHYRLRP